MNFIKNYLDKISCHHDWEQHKVISIYENEEANLPVKTVEILICKKCGKIKKIIV